MDRFDLFFALETFITIFLFYIIHVLFVKKITILHNERKWLYIHFMTVDTEFMTS